MPSIPRLAMALGVLLVAAAAAAEDTTVRPLARAETAQMPHAGDAADDPAIWVHPRRPELSLILGTDKQGGLHVFEPDGDRLQVVDPDCHPNNVDVLYGFPLGGEAVDLAIATTRAKGMIGVKAWAIDPAKRRLRDVTAGPAMSVFGGGTPYGICGYRSPKTGKFYFFVTSIRGPVEQHDLTATERGEVTSRPVRSMRMKSISEGCVADQELGQVYIAEEQVGIWAFDAEPEGGTAGKLAIRIGENKLARDVEGLAIYYAAGGRGYLIASSQGSNTFHVYERQAPHAFVLRIDPAQGRIGDVSDTDGIDVTNQPTSGKFRKGMLVVQDGRNHEGSQNFKMYDWQEIAGERLLIDPRWDPRRIP